jgi:hypothetical protein
MSDDVVRMSSADLLDWFKGYNCSIETLPEYRTPSLRIVNPKTGKEYFMGLPITDIPMKDYLVFRACAKLGIPPPTHATYCRGLHDDIENGE